MIDVGQMALLKFTRKEGEGYRLEPQERSNGRVGGGGADAGGGSAAASASRTYDESIEAIQHELARYAHGDDTVDALQSRPVLHHQLNCTRRSKSKARKKIKIGSRVEIRGKRTRS